MILFCSGRKAAITARQASSADGIPAYKALSYKKLFYKSPVYRMRAVCGSAAVGAAFFLTACGSPFNEPFRKEAVEKSRNPYPEFANIGQIDPPLTTARRANKVSGLMSREREALVGSAGQSQARRQSTPAPSGPARKLDSGEIANIAVDNQTLENAKNRRGTDKSIFDTKKRSVDQRKAEIQRARQLRNATVAAVNSERKRAIDAQNAKIEARNAQIREQQRLQSLRNQEIAKQRAEYEKRKAAYEQRKQEMVARLTDIPEPKSNADLFAIKDQEQVAVIYFDPGKPKVAESDLPVLVEAARLLQAKGGKLLIVGHSSPPADGIVTKENRDANIRISKSRTEAVAIQLRKIGVPLNRMQLEALADTKPVYSIKSANGQSGNRRVEIYRITAESVSKKT